jgi:hypothetical protein
VPGFVFYDFSSKSIIIEEREEEEDLGPKPERFRLSYRSKTKVES